MTGTLHLDTVETPAGILDLSHTDWPPQVGERVRIVPNHVCVSVNLHDSLLAQEGDRLRRIELEARGRS